MAVSTFTIPTPRDGRSMQIPYWSKSRNTILEVGSKGTALLVQVLHSKLYLSKSIEALPAIYSQSIQSKNAHDNIII